LWRFRSRTYDFSKKEKEIELDYTPSPSSFSFRVHEAPSLVSWGDEELKRRIDLDEYLLEIIKDDYRRSELYGSLAAYYFALDDRGKFDENLNKFRELRGDSEDVSALYRRLGDICFVRGELKEAVDYCTRSIELDPGNVGAHYTRGNAYSELNQFEKAISDYDRVIEIDPNFASALGNRGNAYSELNQFEKAISDYDRVIEIDPEDALAYNNRGLAYYELNQVERAIKDYDRAIEIDPEYAHAYNNRGLAYSELNQVERAVKDYDRAIEIDPEYALAYNNRGLAYYELNQVERAVKDYDRAIEIDPEYAHAYNNRGNAYSELNQVERAIKDYDRALELRENLPDKGARVYYFLGEALKRIENFEEAAHAFKTAGIIFFSLKDIEFSLMCVLKGFQLIKYMQNENVEYCGLFIYIVLKDNKTKDILQKIKFQNENLNDIFALALRRDKGENIEKEIQNLSNTITSSDEVILLSLFLQ
jgi:tetratricopeptide (TPR) repeat protein